MAPRLAAARTGSKCGDGGPARPRRPLLPAALYIGFHLIEGEALTPMLLARRFTLNPVLVVISLVFWFWMWGIPGAILSMPMLAVAKIICDRVRPLAALGHFLEA
jgi:predicted PurR-regulated permease PerM